MKNKQTYLLAFLLIILASFIAPPKKGFKIFGTVTGFADSTLIYLEDVSDGTYQHLDSAYIIGNKFYFSGNLKKPFLRTYLATAGFKQKCFLWLENAEIKFEAEKDKFNKAKISGSKIQDEQNNLNEIISTSKNPDEEEQNYVRNNPGAFLSTYLLNLYAAGWGRDSTQELFKNFTKKNKKSKYGKAIAEFLRWNKSLKVGDQFVNFTQKDTSGNKVNIAKFKGKVFLLEFWGSWCGPCREENPGLVRVYGEFKPKGFEIIGVATESKKELWLQAIKEDNLTWINISDIKGGKNKAAIIYGVYYYPTNFLVNKKGIIVGKDLYGEALKEKLQALL